MSTVLLGWELGDGLGHVTKMLEVAHELAARGHTPVLAVKDFAVTRTFLRDVPFQILQAPIWWQAAPNSFRASSFADILAIKGFGDADGLSLLVKAWQGLIELTGAELVVADFAPSLCLAAFEVLPTVVIGAGFSVPPAHGHEFPRLGPSFGTIMASDQILEVVHEVQRRRGRPAPATLPAMMAGSARFVLTFDEIDAYRSARQDAVVEPSRPPGRPLAPAPPNSFFAYLNAAQPGVDQILPKVAAAGFTGSAYLRHASTRVIESARKAGVVVHDQAPPLTEMLAQAAVVIHHGGLNTTETALAAGRPQITLPSHLEHILTARALEGLGVGRSIARHEPPELAAKLMREFPAPSGCSERALDFSQTIEARNYQGCLPQILDCCEALLS